jgi:hypothetical protein
MRYRPFNARTGQKEKTGQSALASETILDWIYYPVYDDASVLTSWRVPLV